jgi:biopolymer transport protein ExbD
MGPSLQRGSRQLDQNAVPTTSLADMMFLLLIFFIMTTTLSRTTGFVTDVPSGSKTGTATSEKTPTVALHDGKIMVDDRPMSMDDLRRYISGLNLDQRPDAGKIIIVSATGNVTYQQYYQIMALIRTSGGIAAIVSEESGQKQ